MNHILMHKRLPVAELKMDESTGVIQAVNTVLVPEHLPVGTLASNGILDRTALNDWWLDRSIPASRSGVREMLEVLDLASTKLLLLKGYGLSLSDHYWICPEGSGLTWDRINFFNNPFSDDMGDILFGGARMEGEFDFSSPDNTSDGFLKKRWKIIDGKRCLIKGGSNPFQQQPFNEVIATKVMERLGIPHIPYTLLWLDGDPYSVCEDFVTPDTELVGAWRVIQTRKKDNRHSVYQHFLRCCEDLGIHDVVSNLDQMLVLDYLIANEDRHLNNFGLLRNPETLEWLGLAPIFDSGSALGYDKTASRIRQGKDIICKPFKKHHEEQLKLVSSFDWIDFAALEDLGDLIRDTFADEAAKELVGSDRIKAIAETAEERVRFLKMMAESRTYTDAATSTADDVENNIAASYDC